MMESKLSWDQILVLCFSFCSCDRTHGGFDCSIEIVSHQGILIYQCLKLWQLFCILMCVKPDAEHIVQSIALIASNAAALLPAYWALRQRVIFLV